MAQPASEAIFVWIGLPLVGAGAGRLLQIVAGWATSLPWAPFQGPFKLVASIPGPQATIGALAFGFVAGLALAALAAAESLTVTVGSDRVTMERDETAREIRRAQLGAVFRDGKCLVLLGRAGEELAGESSDLAEDRLGAAVVAHGYPWRPDGDPYRDEYRRWVEETPGLPRGADALLKARARAMDKGDSDEVAALRAELIKLGVVVRDEKKRQYWRRVATRQNGWDDGGGFR